MTEAEVIKKIQELKQIRPRKDWVFLTKSQILPKEPKRSFGSFLEVFPRFFSQFQYKPVLVTVTVLGVLIGLFGFAQNSLPGDWLYPIKKVSERGQVVFVSQEKLPKYNLDIANKRLEELNKIAETNQVKKLAPAIEEVEVSQKEAVKSVAKITQPEQALEVGKAIEELKENTEIIKSYGVVVNDMEELEEKYQNIIKTIVEREINDLETRSLSEQQKELFEEVKTYYNEENYQEALIKILELSRIHY